jgi:hypothetical protein
MLGGPKLISLGVIFSSYLIFNLVYESYQNHLRMSITFQNVSKKKKIEPKPTYTSLPLSFQISAEKIIFVANTPL